MAGLISLDPQHFQHFYAHLHHQICTNCHRSIKYDGNKTVQLCLAQVNCYFQCSFHLKTRSINIKSNNDHRIHWFSLLFIIFWLIISLSSHCTCFASSSLSLKKIPTGDKLLQFEQNDKLTKYINQMNKINTKIIPNKMKLFKQGRSICFNSLIYLFLIISID